MSSIHMRTIVLSWNPANRSISYKSLFFLNPYKVQSQRATVLNMANTCTIFSNNAAFFSKGKGTRSQTYYSRAGGECRTHNRHQLHFLFFSESKKDVLSISWGHRGSNAFFFLGHIFIFLCFKLVLFEIVEMMDNLIFYSYLRI